ncbi:MAG TPA: NAD-dependent epimerase/dehydratase family protein [Bacteriovoracaceae bacterium]|nr:NAD-dependent epimerase/dehydratase family protein [Bacteriovoracaceae bacterium]
MNTQGIILITGISGYIGSAFAKVLTPEYQVIGLDKDIPAEKIPGVSYFSLDITSASRIDTTLQDIKDQYGSRIISVIHLVAYYSFDGREDKRYDTITVQGTRALMRQIREKFHTEQFIFSSSMLVYRPVEIGEKIREDSPLQPGWAYPASKVRTEEILKKEQGNVPVVNLRIAGVYDDFAHQPTLANQIMRIHETWLTSVPLPANPDKGQSLLHIDDLALMIPPLIKKREEFARFETFVIGEENVMSYREIQQECGMLLHKRPWPVIRIPRFVATYGSKMMEKMPYIRTPFIRPWMIPHADEHFDVDLSKSRSVLAWQPEHDLRNKLPVIVSNLKTNPSKWYAINKIEKPFYRPLEWIGSDAERNLWLAAIGNIFLGIWSMANPFGFGNLERGEFLAEIILGFLITLVAILSLVPTLRWFRWVNAGLGTLLMFAPLAFFTTSDAAYLSDTLIGGIVILLSVYTPPLPGEDAELGKPPGWTYNPSTAGQRLPIMLLAFIGFLLSRNLASFQLLHIPDVWDPWFGDGTRRVLTSDISKAFPVSDAGLGSLTYLLDVIAGAMGGRNRWRTMPWAVIMFGFMIVPTGVTSITLVMLQPIGVGAWCTLCLITAFIMLIMVPPAVDEVLASIQFLKRRKNAGEPFWRVFWLGSETAEVWEPRPVPKKGNLINIIVCSILGMWLMLAPAYFGIKGMAASNIYIIAALIVTFSIIAYNEVSRITRLFNIPFALWLSVSAFFLGEMSEVAQWHSLIVGLVITFASLPMGKRMEAFGSSDSWIHWTPLKR